MKSLPYGGFLCSHHTAEWDDGGVPLLFKIRLVRVITQG
jgi:hypothetical protein